MKKYITIHSVSALQSKTGCLSYIRCNIPIENESKVIELYGDSDLWYLEYHSIPYNNKIML